MPEDDVEDRHVCSNKRLKKTIKKSSWAKIFIPIHSAKVDTKSIYSENVFTCFWVSLRLIGRLKWG